MGAVLLASRICAQVGALRVATPNDESLGFTVSIGVAAFGDADDYVSLLDRADRAMYAAKQQGGNQIAFG